MQAMEIERNIKKRLLKNVFKDIITFSRFCFSKHKYYNIIKNRIEGIFTFIFLLTQKVNINCHRYLFTYALKNCSREIFLTLM